MRWEPTKFFNFFNNTVLFVRDNDGTLNRRFEGKEVVPWTGHAVQLKRMHVDGWTWAISQFTASLLFVLIHPRTQWMQCCINNNNKDNKTTTKASSRTKHKFASCEKQVRHSFSLFFLNQITSCWNVVAVDPVVVVMSFFLFFCISVPCTDSATWVIFFSVEQWFASQKSEWSVRRTACPGLRVVLMHGQSVEDFIILIEEQFNESQQLLWWKLCELESRVGQQCWWTDDKIGGRMWLMEKELF